MGIEREQKAGGLIASHHQSVFDRERHQLDHPQRVGLRQISIAGDVEHADQTLFCIQDGGSTAGHKAVRFQIMLITLHLNGLTGGNSGANCVGAAGLLEPTATFNEQ